MCSTSTATTTTTTTANTFATITTITTITTIVIHTNTIAMDMISIINVETWLLVLLLLLLYGFHMSTTAVATL